MNRSLKRSVGVVALGLAAAATTSILMGQVPPAPTPGPATQPAAAPATGQPQPAATPVAPIPNGAPTTAPTTGPAAPPSTQISLRFRDASIDAVIESLSSAAGFIVYRDKEVVGPIPGRVEQLVSVTPVPAAEAIGYLNTALRAQGLTAIQSGRLLQIMKIAKAKGQAPVMLITKPGDVPLTDDTMITAIIPVRSIDAARLRQDLTILIGTEADVTANQGSNSIVMTDRAANVRRVVEIIATMDQQPGSSSDIRVTRLKNADSASAARLITSIFTTAAQGGGQGGRGGGEDRAAAFRAMMGGGFGGGGRGGPGGGAPGGGGGGESIDRALATGKVTAASDDRTNTLVVTGPAETLKLIDKIVTVLEADDSAQSDLKTFKLLNADATSAARLVTTLFQADTRTGGGNQGGGGGGRFGGGGGGNSGGGGTGGSAGFNQILRGGKVTATADERTNTVVITAPEAAMRLVAGVLADLDKDPITQDSFFIYPLRNAQAVKLEYVLNNLFGSGTSGGSGLNRGTTTAGQSRFGNSGTSSLGGGGSTTGRGGGGGLTGRSAGQAGTGARRGTQTYGATGQQGGGQLGQNRGGAASAAGELAGQAYVVADEDTNSLLVSTASKYREQVRQVIAQLDRPVPQVLIKVLVAEVTHDNSSDFGVDFSILNRRANGNGQSIGATLGNAGAGLINGGLVVNLLETNVNATLHALGQQGKLDVLSRPYILASDNQLATITVGQDVPFVTNTRVTEAGQTINTIQYDSVGIILNVIPHINPEGLVILDVAPEISQLTGTSVQISEGLSSPIIARRSAESRVGIKNGQTIVIGGLMEDRKTQTISKIPLLGDLPLLGPAFSRTQYTKSKTELLIFLTPHVAQQPEALRPMADDEVRGTKLTPNAVEPGMFQDHQRGLRRGATELIPPSTRPAEPAPPAFIPGMPRGPKIGPTEQQPGNDAPMNDDGGNGGGNDFGRGIPDALPPQQRDGDGFDGFGN